MRNKLKKIKGKHSYKISWIPKDSDWDSSFESWDGQWFYEIYFEKRKIGEAAFIDSESSSVIMPCDFWDTAIEIDTDHQRKGLGSFILKDIQNRTKKTLIYNLDRDHSIPGLKLLGRMNIKGF